MHVVNKRGKGWEGEVGPQEMLEGYIETPEQEGSCQEKRLGEAIKLRKSICAEDERYVFKAKLNQL